jgi:hypothetical protein
MTIVLDCAFESNVEELFQALFSDSCGKQFYRNVMVDQKDIDISIGGMA